MAIASIAVYRLCSWWERVFPCGTQDCLLSTTWTFASRRAERRPYRTEWIRQDHLAERSSGSPSRLQDRSPSAAETSPKALRIGSLSLEWPELFQNIRLFGNLTVLENVQIGSALNKARHRGAQLHDAAEAVVNDIGLAPHRDRRAATLPYGVRRRVEIARALATQPDFLLLDEPAAGANESESDDLCELIESIMANYRLGILVIEHDLRLMMRVAHRIVALTEGRVVAQGDAEYISKHQAVREAYFGKRWTEEQDRKAATVNIDSVKEAP